MSRDTIDVSKLPDFAFHHRGIVWWGTVGMIAIEGSMFALLIVAYLYLKGREPHWPPGVLPPALLWGTINTAILVASAVPNHITKRAAEHLDLPKTRLWLGIALLFSFAFNAVRIFEFRALNVWWDTNAYGSIVWTLLGFHTFHLVTDLIDSTLILVLLFTGPMKESQFVDVAENSMYWDFVLVAWIPVYAVIYLAPRFW